jgi:hypothetical protein
VAISVKAAPVDNTSHLDYLASGVALEEPEIGSSDPNILTDNNCTDVELHFRMPGGSGDYEDEPDESDNRNAIPTASWRRRPVTALERFDMGTRDVYRYEGEDCDDSDADAEDEALQADDGSMRNVED